MTIEHPYNDVLNPAMKTNSLSVLMSRPLGHCAGDRIASFASESGLDANVRTPRHLAMILLGRKSLTRWIVCRRICAVGQLLLSFDRTNKIAKHDTLQEP